MKKILDNQEGVLLLEALIAIAVLAMVGMLVAQIMFTNLQANKLASEQVVALGLAEELVAASEGVAFEHWNNIFSLTKGADYHPEISGTSSWRLASGAEVVNLNGLDYTRSVIVEDVCRENVSKAVVPGVTTPCTGLTHADPSVQRIKALVSWNGQNITKEIELSRWRNQACEQTSWSGVTGSTVNCGTTNYESKNNIDTNITPGSLKLQAN